MEVTVFVTFTLDDEWLETLIEMAGQQIGYWCGGAEVDPDLSAGPVDKVIYTVTVKPEERDPEWPQQHELTRGDIALALSRICNGVKGLHPSNKTLVLRAMHDAADIDADVADWVIQVACFGEVVFG